MNKVDPFFTLIIVLLAGLCVTYKAAQYDLSGLKFQMQVNAELKEKIKRLELKQKAREIENTSSGLASGGHVGLASEKNREPASIEEVLDPKILAQKMYFSARKNCTNSRSQLNCVESIDAVVTQFPETKWAGESLLLLSDLYFREKKSERARDVLRFVKEEFKKDNDLQKKLKDYENRSL